MKTKRTDSLDGWLSVEEAQSFIAASNPYAPKNYYVIGMFRSKTRSNIRRMKFCGRLYIHETDLKESLRRYPLYEGKRQSVTEKSWIRAPHHNYVTSLPKGERDWVSISYAARLTGEKRERITSFVRSLKLKGLMYKGRIHIRLTTLWPLLMLRTDQFIRRCGKEPASYPIADCYYYAGTRFNIRYAPDLIGK